MSHGTQEPACRREEWEGWKEGLEEGHDAHPPAASLDSLARFDARQTRENLHARLYKGMIGMASIQSRVRLVLLQNVALQLAVVAALCSRRSKRPRRLRLTSLNLSWNPLGKFSAEDGPSSQASLIKTDLQSGLTILSIPLP